MAINTLREIASRHAVTAQEASACNVFHDGGRLDTR
jgi:hypothetical protein